MTQRLEQNLCCSKPEVIFMDLQMPKIDGFEASAQIISLCNDKGMEPPPIVAISASKDQVMKEKAQRIGMKYFIEKPASVAILKQVLLDLQIIQQEPVSQQNSV